MFDTYKKLCSRREAAQCLSVVQYLEHGSSIINSGSDLPVHTIKFCFVIFGVMSRLFVIKEIQ